MQNNFKKEVIKKLGENLMEYGFSVQKEEDTENDLLTLRCGFVLSDEQPVPMVMEMTFYNLDPKDVAQIMGVSASTISRRMGLKDDGAFDALQLQRFATKCKCTVAD